MKTSLIVFYVFSLIQGSDIHSSTPIFYYPRPRSGIVQEKLFPQILLEKSLREKKIRVNHSGKKCGVFLIKDDEKLSLPKV
jgi:hypothetical protein